MVLEGDTLCSASTSFTRLHPTPQLLLVAFVLVVVLVVVVLVVVLVVVVLILLDVGVVLLLAVVAVVVLLLFLVVVLLLFLVVVVDFLLVVVLLLFRPQELKRVPPEIVAGNHLERELSFERPPRRRRARRLDCYVIAAV